MLDSATTDSLSNKDDSKINHQIAADNVPVSQRNDETEQLDDIKKEQEKVPSENAISPANDTNLKANEKYTSSKFRHKPQNSNKILILLFHILLVELGEIKDPPKKSPTSGFLNKVRNIPRNELLKWLAGIVTVLIIIIIIIVVTTNKKTDDHDDDYRIARKSHDPFFSPGDDHFDGPDSNFPEETKEEIDGSETHPSEGESPLPTPPSNLHNSNESTTTGPEERTTWSTSTLSIPIDSDSSV